MSKILWRVRRSLLQELQSQDPVVEPCLLDLSITSVIKDVYNIFPFSPCYYKEIYQILFNFLRDGCESEVFNLDSKVVKANLKSSERFNHVKV